MGSVLKTPGQFGTRKYSIESHSSTGSMLFAVAVSLLLRLKLTMRDS
jgi:hypothetical protein